MEVALQRLFSTFADGWPGAGLLLQRLATAAALLSSGAVHLRAASLFSSSAPQLIAGFAGIFLLAGLWTPVAGGIVAAAEIWIVVSGGGGAWAPVLLAALGASLAMIGPGAWSLDARLFGRKHIDTSTR